MSGDAQRGVRVRACFDRIPGSTITRGVSLSGCLMSGLAVFPLGFPSLPLPGTSPSSPRTNLRSGAGSGSSVT